MSFDNQALVYKLNLTNDVRTKIDSFLYGDDMGLADRIFPENRKRYRDRTISAEGYRKTKDRYVAGTVEGKAPGGDLELCKRNDDDIVTWNMKEFGKKIRYDCYDKTQAELVETDPINKDLETMTRIIKNSQRKQLYEAFLDQNKNKVVAFNDASLAGDFITEPTSDLSKALLAISKRFLPNAEFVYVPWQLICEMQTHPNVKERSSNFVGSAAESYNNAVGFLAEHLNIPASQIFVDRAVETYDETLEEYTYANDGSGMFLYAGNYEHVRFYEHTCSDTLTEEEHHIRVDWEYRRTFDTSLTDDKAGGTLVNMFVAP